MEDALALTPPATGIAALLAEHPWPREYADAHRIEWLWTIDVAAPPDRMWPLIADLSRLNRALHLPRMRFEEREGVRWGRARYSGVLHEWVEVPWNWVAGKWYELVRLYKRGGMRALYGVYVLEPLAAARPGDVERKARDKGHPQEPPEAASAAANNVTGTRVHVYYGVVPRARILELPMKMSFAAMGRAYKRLLPRVAEEAMREVATPPVLRVPPEPLRPEAKARLDQLAASLVAGGLERGAVAQLVEHVRSAEDADIERIRVRERARAWGIDEDELLRVCLHATRAGMLELTWDVVCPHCRGVRDSPTSLGAVPSRGRCDACGIDFGTDTSEAIEIAFHAHSSIRPVARATFCSAEPAHKPHIQIQRTVPAGATLEVEAPEPGRYRMRMRGEMAAAWLEVGEGVAEWKASELRDLRGGRLRLVNDSSGSRTFVIERAAWLELALRPGRLLSFRDFRDLFSEEYLGADVQLAVGEQTILFTDVVGSTAMYAQRGDPAAFVEVKRHFDDVFAIIGEHRGAVVKTIGDAAMGAFNDPIDAVRAARAIHLAFPEGRTLRLRISINTGPCIAVRLNAAIDYFGHAVNVAAKLQAMVETSQIAIADTTYAAPGVAAWLDEQGAALEDVEVVVKGVAERVHAKRWTV